MGILRADRITGLGGANAIKGSVFFPQNSYINVEPDSDLDLSGDFTIEMWVYNLPGPTITTYQRQISSKGYYTAGNDGNWYFGFNQNSSYNILFYSYDGTGSAESVSGTCTSNLDEWYHIAASRSGSTLKLFVNGVEEASGTLSKGLDDGGNNGLFIGGISSTLGTDSYGDHYGYTSNIRIIKGRALYTAAFTPPAFELNQTSDTTLLCCQSSGNVLQEKTGKILSINNHYGNTNSQGVMATRFTPNSPVGFSTTTDVGSQYGSTFDGFGSFATSTYMVPPGGNTRERNRGRGLVGGGYSPSVLGQIYSVEIASDGTSADFGDLSLARRGTGAVGSHTRGIWAGGYAPGYQDRIDFVTFANSANAIDFGNLDTTRFEASGVSNDTRGVYGPSENPAGDQTVIQYITMATAGNATDFGDSTVATKKQASMNSTTRGLFAGGQNVPSPLAYYDIIDKITIASTGNAADFGDLTENVFMCTGVSDSTRGIRGGGAKSPSPANTNTMDYVTIASDGNATDFGDLTTANQRSGGMSNSKRGIFAGGATPNSTTFVNSIDKITIQSTGDATDFGDYIGTAASQGAGCSDSHGGLS